MMLHHEVIQATGTSVLSLVAWVVFGGNAAVFYTRRWLARRRGGK
jgi:ABC-type uncharacterized transport system permease subunit